MNTILKVIIESPFRPICKKSKIPFFGKLFDTWKHNRLLKRNIDYGFKCVKWCIDRGYSPIASHLLFPVVINDDNEDERKKGMDLGHAWIDTCDMMVVFTDYGVSEGMRIAIEKANKIGKTIAYHEIL